MRVAQADAFEMILISNVFQTQFRTVNHSTHRRIKVPAHLQERPHRPNIHLDAHVVDEVEEEPEFLQFYFDQLQ